MKIIHFFIISLLLVTLFSLSANATYNQVGYNDYVQDRGIFNRALNNYERTAYPYVNNPLNPPLVADLDGDGINEVILQDGNDFIIYQNNTLEEIDGYQITGSGLSYSNIQVLDIDNDNLTEIVVLTEVNPALVSLFVLQFNNSELTLDDYIPSFFDGTNYNGGDLMLGCDPTNYRCLGFATYQKQYYAVNSNHLRVKGYNGSDGGTTNVGGADLVQSLSCFPRIKDVQVKDLDHDGTIEYGLTYYSASITGTDYVKLNLWRYDNPPVLEKHLDIDDVIPATLTLGAGQYCNNTIYDGDYNIMPMNAFSSPLIVETDNRDSNGMEIYVGMVINTVGFPEFKVFSYYGYEVDPELEEIRSYPMIYEAQGMIISNPFVADVFEETGEEDICIMGYDVVQDQVDVLCLSPRKDSFAGYFGYGLSTEFYYNAEDLPLLDYETDNMNILTHSSQQYDGNGYAGKDNSEIITPYGVFQLTNEKYALLTSVYSLDLIFPNPAGQSSTVILADVQGNGVSDMLVLTDTNLYYYDDAYINKPAYISGYEINPCVDLTIKVNETMTVLVTPKDNESDKVRARVTAYYSDPNEQASNFTQYVDSGTVLGGTFEFKMNKTGNAFKLKIEVNDEENPEDITTIIRNFNVGNFGVVRGECITTEKDLPDPSITPDQGEDKKIKEGTGAGTNLDDNIMTNLLTYFADETGLGAGILFLLIIALVVWSIAQAEAESSKKHGTPFNMTGVLVYSLIACFILLIIGTLLGLISYSIIMIIIVVLIFALSMMFRHLFTGSRL